MQILPIGFGRTAAALAVAMALVACGKSPDKLIDSARQHLEHNDSAAAVIELKNALADNPNLAEARFLLGSALLTSGDPTGAEVELQKAAALKYDADKVAVLLTRSLLMRGQFKKVVDVYAKQTPADALVHAELKTNVAGAYAALGQRAEAEAALTAALAAKPDYAPALLGQARLKMVTGDSAAAQTIVDGVLAKNPKDIEALMFRAAMQAATGKREAALETYRAVLAIRPDNATAYAALITASLQDKKIDDAQKQLEAMQKVLPKNPSTLYMQSMVAFQQKNLQLALDSVQSLLRIAPNDPRVLQLAGSIEFEKHSDLQAQEHLSQAVARAPNADFGRRLLVRSYLRTGQFKRALDALQPALDAKAPSAAMLALAGEVYIQLGDAEKAEAYFSRASKMDPENARNRTALALLQGARGDGHAVSELESIAATDKGTTADMALIATSMKLKHYDEALKAIAVLEKKQPDNLAVYNLRAAALYAKGDVAGARHSLEQALSRNPAYFPAAAALARLDLVDKKPDQAVARFESVLAKDPKNVQALLTLAEIHSHDGRSQEVPGLIKRAVDAAPNDALPRVAQISYLINQKDTKGAVTAAQAAMEALPDRPEILDIAGRAQQANGNLNEASVIYNKLIALVPNTPQPYIRLAEVELAAKNRDAARDALMRGLHAQPASLPLQRAIIIMNVEDKRYTEALQGAQAIVKQEPKQAMGYLLEGDVLAAQKSWSAAQIAYRKGLTQLADNNELAMRLYVALISGTQESEAAKFAASWLKAHPKDLDFSLYLASNAIMHKDYAAAVAYYRRILEIQPNNAVVLNDFAWALGQLGDPKALGYAQQANRLAPNQPALMDTLGMLQVQNGQIQDGIALLRKALEIAPQANNIRLNLARALLKSGDKSGAKSELETLSKLGDKYAHQADVSALLKSL